jgi:hypothetical protein
MVVFLPFRYVFVERGGRVVVFFCRGVLAHVILSSSFLAAHDYLITSHSFVTND